MRGWMILVLVLAGFWLVCQLRLGVGAEYRTEGLRIWLRAGVWSIPVFPLKKKKRTKQSRPPQPEKPRAEQPAQKEEPPKSNWLQQLGGALDYAQAMLPILLEAGGRVRQKIRVDKLRLKVTVGAVDPADAAMRYGEANGALGILWGTLNEVFDLRDGKALAAVDFDASETTVYALAALSLKLGQMVWLGLYFGSRALRAFLQVRSRRKQEQQQRKAA